MQDKPAIAFFTRYLPNMGGVEFFTDNLAKQLKLDGYLPIIVTTDQAPKNFSRDFPILRLPNKSLLGGRYPIPLHSTQLSELQTTLSKHGVEHYVINGRFYPLSRIGAKLARQAGHTPIVIDHSSSYVSDTRSPLGACLAIADHITTALLKRHSPKFYCVSKGSSQWLQRFGIASSGEIHNALDSQKFRLQSEYIDLPIAPENKEHHLKVAYAGRLIEEKGVRELIEAITPLHDMELYIAGSGPLEDYAQKQSSAIEHVHFLGRLSHATLASLLLQADIFCFPTRYGEGLPTCLLEAGACGCALITTNTGGTDEIIPNSTYGIRIGDTAPNTIATALQSLIDDPDLLQDLQRRIQVHIETQFTWQNTEHQLLRALEIESD